LADSAERGGKPKSLKAPPSLSSVIDAALRKSLPVPPDQWDDYSKDLLRRLDFRGNLDSSDKVWAQLWAAGEALGIQDERIERMTPHQLCAALEYKATEMGRAKLQARQSRQFLDPLDPLFELKKLGRKLIREGATHFDICRRFGPMPRPPDAKWKSLPWDKAYAHPTYRRTVSKWISKHCGKSAGS
jgi:hypothetical protein